MEAHLAAVPSPTRLWWIKVGQWQALATLLTLGAFFVTLDVTGDTEDAAFVAITVAVFITIVTAFTAAIVAFVAAFVAAIAAITVFVTIAIAIAIAAAVIIIATVIAVNEIPGISRKTIWLSYAGEFLLVLLPMLVALRG